MDDRSERNLIGVHADLVKVVRKAYDDWTSFPNQTFVVTEGVRSPERQAELYKAGASQTLNSRHLTGHAVDLAAKVGGVVTWHWPIYQRLALVMKSCSRELEIPISWGGDFKHFKDGVHFELDRGAYP